MRVAKALISSLTLFSLLACQGGSTPEEIKEQQAANEVVEHSSEGMVGPDDAFFAGLYLEQIFRSSQGQQKPQLNPSLSLAQEHAQVQAFDFAANFSEARLQLMVNTLLQLGDSDKDGALGEAEFLALKLDLSVLGLGKKTVDHQYSRELFQQAAGEQASLDTEGLKSLLRGLAPLVKASIDQKSAKEQRLEVIRAWEKILAQYDADQSGSLNATEQRALRQERSEIMARLQAH